jgi:hypothetical protein
VRLDNAMMDVYRPALAECDYKATRFLHMLHEHRGLGTARFCCMPQAFRKVTSPCGGASALISRWKRSSLGRNRALCSRNKNAKSRAVDLQTMGIKSFPK